MLYRGLHRAALPRDRPRLIHAVIVCEYREPYDVLATTIRSLRSQTLCGNLVVVLACESRDEEAAEVYRRLKASYGAGFRDFLMTSHVLQPGEVAGKSSNERWACRELYDVLQAQGVDPSEVMVTTCDADSHFDRVFLEQLEAEYCRLPDGRQTLFDSPINTYRNLRECHPLVAMFEISRTQFCTFSALEFTPTQSNYSLLLSFAHDMDYWSPDNTSEDMHTCLKALALSNGGINTVVPVWSLILNDSVTGFYDRWVQAKRHMWGVEEVAWVLSIYHVVRFRVWVRMLALTGGQLLTTTVVPPWFMFLFPSTWRIFFNLPPLVIKVLVVPWLATYVYAYLKTWVREAVLHNVILAHRRTMLTMGPLRWLQLVVLYPVLLPLGHFVFNCCATWRMLWHAIWHDSLRYVTAPKTLVLEGVPLIPRGSSAPSRLASAGGGPPM